MPIAAVFGGSGKLGRRVIHHLLEHGYGVRALVHRTPVDAAVTSIRGSVDDPEAVAQVVAGAEVVVHLATAKEDPATFFQVSLGGTFQILEACRANPVRQFILFGGDAAFGIWFYPQPLPIAETHPKLAYPGYYAFSKVMEETMAQQYAVQYDLPVTILRSSWVFDGDDILNHLSLLKNVDPSEPGHGFGEVNDEVLSLVRAGEERIPVLCDADGTPLYRHIVHIDDVIQAFELLLDRPVAIGQDFNIAAPAPFNYRVAADYLSERTGLPTITLNCAGYHSFQIDIAKARSVLGYQPANDIFAIIDRALACRAAQ